MQEVTSANQHLTQFSDRRPLKPVEETCFAMNVSYFCKILSVCVIFMYVSVHQEVSMRKMDDSEMMEMNTSSESFENEDTSLNEMISNIQFDPLSE